MIIGIIGLMSSGKSIVATHLCLTSGKGIISNSVMNIDYLRLDYDGLIDAIEIQLNAQEVPKNSLFYNRVLYIDEIHLIDSRRASSDLNVLFTQFTTQLGKLDCDFIYTSQLDRQIDIRIMEFTEIFIYVKRVNEKGQTILTSNRIVDYPVFIKGDVYIKKDVRSWIHKKFILNPANVYKFYDTRQIILLDRSKYKKK